MENSIQEFGDDRLSPEQEQSPERKKGYFHLSRTVTYSIIFVLPILIAYEFLIALINESQIYGIRNGADVIIKNFLSVFGSYTPVFMGILVLIGFGIAFYYERKKYKFQIKKKYFAFMLLESVAYGLLLGIVVSKLTSLVLPGLSNPALQQSGGSAFGVGTQLVLSLGAGIYEELLFRVILVTIFLGIMRLIAKTWKRWIRYTIAAIVAAFIFSAFHYVGSFGDQFTLASFTFRFIAGLALNGLYLSRGFGIAVWTHALYDVFITLGQL
jgi:hypothetical protein